MKAKKIKIRKDRKCDQCDKIMQKGTVCMFFSGRMPRFDNEDNQIGIEYFKEYCHMPELDCNVDYPKPN